MAQSAVTLDDKYSQASGRVFLSGLQALVRLPMMQRQLDLAAGHNTAGFISGYRGSPLSGYDLNLWRARPFLKQNHIEFQPGVNEELAATAVWGTQTVGLYPDNKYDGVFGIWYGKNPGVDRSGDVFKHGNAAGTSKLGGVLCISGDDPGAVSSSMPNQSDHAFIGHMMPVLFPAGVQEFLEFGLAGIAMSRYSGCWVGFKAVSETAESSATVDVSPERFQFALPDDFEMPEIGPHAFDERIAQEFDLHNYKINAALAFARANRLDRVVIDSPKPRFGIVTVGKSYLDLRQALDDLGIDDALAAELGIRVYKVGMPWPLEPVGLRRFAEGLEEIVVVEEKRAMIENQLKEQLYGLRDAVRPDVVGKRDGAGQSLLPSTGELTPVMVARVLARRLERFDSAGVIADRLETLEARERASGAAQSNVIRIPYFCSGCPHNTSTRVPEGSHATAGIGCHFMAVWMDRSTATYTAMGGEGTTWIGQAPFTEMNHIFANLGDGTYYHSGVMAIRAAIAADVNITYKLLYNDATAMTGGQPVEGGKSVPEIVSQVVAEGAKKVVVVSDEPDKYPAGATFPPGVTVHHRAELDQVQRDLREIDGVTVLVYDQTCAAEKRRRRKRGLYPDPPKRVFINDLVCEGCGDCSAKSNCVSVQPLETEFGRKRRIDQSACNKDFSCLEGFCPSFVTVHGGAVKRLKADSAGDPDFDMFTGLAVPATPTLDRPYNMLVTGVGGTGVITLGALLGMAAHIEGKACTVLDNTGLAQKNGAVMSQIRIGNAPDDLHAVRIAGGGADLLLGCDMVVASSPDALAKVQRGATHAIVNSFELPTAEFVLDNDAVVPGAELKRVIREAAGDNLTEFVDGTDLATSLMGDSIATNLFMLGYAFQRGLVPLAQQSIEQAIALNGVAVETSLATFNWGRLAAQDLTAVVEQARPVLATRLGEPRAATLDDIVAKRVEFLAAYQDAAYAGRYRALVATVEAAERDRVPGRGELAEAVARNLFKLMAYKDEYEVARLYTGRAFLDKLHAQFEGDFELNFHLAPPLLARRDPTSGELQKRAYGPWVLHVFRILAKLKGLRGTALDVFGYTQERKTERRLIDDYEAMVKDLAAGLGPENHAPAVALAQLPDGIRGYGHIKQAAIAAAESKQTQLWAAFQSPPGPQAEAAE